MLTSVQRVALSDVEDITSKTGSYKRFPVFLAMLRSALMGDSDTVSVDLLTYKVRMYAHYCRGLEGGKSPICIIIQC